MKKPAAATTKESTTKPESKKGPAFAKPTPTKPSSKPADEPKTPTPETKTKTPTKSEVVAEASTADDPQAPIQEAGEEEKLEQDELVDPGALEHGNTETPDKKNQKEEAENSSPAGTESIKKRARIQEFANVPAPGTDAP